MDDKGEAKVSTGKSFNKLRENPWIISTIVLAVVGVVLIFYLSSGGLGGAGGVSGQTAGQNLVSFVNAQGGGNASLVSAEKDGTLYKVTVKYNGQDIPVFVTLDGKYLVTTPVPLTDDVKAAAAANTADDSDTAQNAQPTSVPKTDKPVVNLFVMAYCPYGTQAEKGIIPAIEALKGKVDFKIRFVSYAMHGQKEIDENTLQYCIQKEQTSKYFSYLTCFLQAGDSASCLTNVSIDKTKLNSCINATDKQFNITALFNDKSTWLNGNYPQFNIDAADGKKYGVQGSPTLVINGVQSSSARDSASYLKAICAAFNTAPSECSTQLSSTAPSAGFGYAASTTGSATAAQCG
jgi:hypothetical protein